MIRIHAIGSLKSGPEHDLCQLYLKRLGTSVVLKEFEVKEKQRLLRQKKESELLLNSLHSRECLIVLDERGKNLSTKELMLLLVQIKEEQGKRPVFVIGGAEGHTMALRHKAQHTISFGALTWPHKLVRVMLLEQLYRCQQIMAGHPYHRD
jgi:23S rRNA (pseudouridine1915-N3)-methyltransferase